MHYSHLVACLCASFYRASSCTERIPPPITSFRIRSNNILIINLPWCLMPHWIHSFSFGFSQDTWLPHLLSLSFLLGHRLHKLSHTCLQLWTASWGTKFNEPVSSRTPPLPAFVHSDSLKQIITWCVLLDIFICLKCLVKKIWKLLKFTHIKVNWSPSSK